MNRYVYQQLSKQHYLDMQSGNVLTKSDLKLPYNLRVPAYLWDDTIQTKVVTGFELVNGKMQNQYSNVSKVYTVELRGLKIMFSDTKSASMYFYDNRTKMRQTILLEESGDLVNITGKGNRVYLAGTRYLLSFGGVSREFYIVYPTERGFFKGVGYLAQRTDENMPKSSILVFSYGLLPNKQFKIKYKERELDGACYVFLFGTWAVLLQDNLSFDAFVLLKGVTKDVLDIAQIIYTSNPYLAKCITLW